MADLAADRDAEGLARTLTDIGWYALIAGGLGEAQRTLDESLELRRRQGDARGLTETLAKWGRLAVARGELTRRARRSPTRSPRRS